MSRPVYQQNKTFIFFIRSCIYKNTLLDKNILLYVKTFVSNSVKKNIIFLFIALRWVGGSTL